MIDGRAITKTASGIISIGLLLAGLCAGWLSVGPAQATRVPEDLAKAVQEIVPKAHIRLDGSLETSDGHLYVPLLPVAPVKKGKAEVEAVLPDLKNPSLLICTNGWAFARLTKKGAAAVLELPPDIPEKLKKKVAYTHLPSDLIVPEGFVVPKSLKSMAVDLNVSILDDAIIAKPEFGQKKKDLGRANYNGPGTVFLTSITAGSIMMVDGKTFNKVAEFPTEGTPCSMQLTNGQLYIADQAKDRILVLDPITRRFLGQIDLAAHSAPKGLAGLPDGKWLYVSESGTSDVAVVELSNGKVLLRTKVHPGPGRMRLTPDGTYLLVLNVTAGEVTIISTYNQKVISTVKVGDMPTGIAVSHDGKIAYISNRMSNTISVIDISKRGIIGTIKTGNTPTGLALSNDGTKLFVANGRDNTVSIFDTKSLLELHNVKLPAGLDFPGGLCVLPGKKLLVTGQQSDSIAVMNTDTLEFEKQSKIGHASHEIVWEPLP